MGSKKGVRPPSKLLKTSSAHITRARVIGLRVANQMLLAHESPVASCNLTGEPTTVGSLCSSSIELANWW